MDHGALSALIRNTGRNVKKKKWASFTVRVTITLLLFALLFKSLSWSTLLAAMARANHVFILLSVPVGGLGPRSRLGAEHAASRDASMGRRHPHVHRDVRCAVRADLARAGRDG